MKRNVTELVFLLDRSGSMAGLESDTIGGFNSMLKKQRKGSDRVYVSTVLFDDRMEVLHDRVPAERVKPLTEKQYSVRGCTALLDAVGRMISHMIRVQKQAGEGRRGKVIFVITTDGLETVSYTHLDVYKRQTSIRSAGYDCFRMLSRRPPMTASSFLAGISTAKRCSGALPAGSLSFLKSPISR